MAKHLLKLEGIMIGIVPTFNKVVARQWSNLQGSAVKLPGIDVGD